MALFGHTDIPEDLENSIDVGLCLALSDNEELRLATVKPRKGLHGATEFLSMFESYTSNHKCC